jgi:hypothetical protein
MYGVDVNKVENIYLIQPSDRDNYQLHLTAVDLNENKDIETAFSDKRKIFYQKVKQDRIDDPKKIDIYDNPHDTYEFFDLETKIEDTVDTEHPVYKLLEPYVDRKFIDKTSKLIPPKITDNMDNYSGHDRVNLWYFVYNETETRNNNSEMKMTTWQNNPLPSFHIKFLNAYLITTDNVAEYLYIAGKPLRYKPNTIKPILYRYAEAETYCCGSGFYYFYRIQKQEQINYSQKDLKSGKSVLCQQCHVKLPKWVVDDNGLKCNYDRCLKIDNKIKDY